MLSRIGKALLGHQRCGRQFVLAGELKGLCATTPPAEPQREAESGEGGAESTAEGGGEGASESSPAKPEGSENVSTSAGSDMRKLGMFEYKKRKFNKRPPRYLLGDLGVPGTLDAEIISQEPVGGRGLDAKPVYDMDDFLKENAPHLRHYEHDQGVWGPGGTDDPHMKNALEVIQEEVNQEYYDESIKPGIFEWDVGFVLTNFSDDHPKNRKVKCRVFLRELQREYDLSEEALQHIVRICDRRYDRNTGRLTITADKYPLSEDNRRECMRIINALLIECYYRHPNTPEQRSGVESIVQYSDLDLKIARGEAPESDLENLLPAEVVEQTAEKQ